MRYLRPATFLACLLAQQAALANGRFPRAERLFESPNNPNRLTVAATYGLLVTDDRGKSWYHVCEASFSFDPLYADDPVLALLSDDSMLATTQARMTRTTDRACEWTKVLDAPGIGVDDFTVASSNKNNVIALTHSFRDGALTSQLEESIDAGEHWKPLGTPLPAAIVYTVDIDPTDATHIYATGITSTAADVDTGILLLSTDHGSTWTSRPIPKTNINAVPYIAAVHPSDPNRLFVRTDEWTDNMFGGQYATDALLYTSDGGKTWTELLRPKGPEGGGGKLFGFALSPDGSTVLAGFGDPVSGGGRDVDPSQLGVYMSSGQNYSFGASPVPIFRDPISCLTWTPTGIYLCGAPNGATSYIAFAKEVSALSTSSFATLMKANEVRGIAPCCTGRAASTCDWNRSCPLLDACKATDASTPAQDGSACSQPDASVDISRETGSGGGPGGASATDAGPLDASSGGSSNEAGRASANGCSCRTKDASPAHPVPRFTFLLSVLTAFFRRRRINTRGNS